MTTHDESGSGLGSKADLVGALAEDFLQRLRAGERPPLVEYQSLHPEIAERIGELFPILEMMEDVSPSGPARKAAGNLDENPPKQLGAYLIKREVGRGGMGIVYEAIQAPLNRRVAVKVFHGKQSDSRVQRERFQREARAAALLHHTNIVPVFDVGEQDGIAYYAMQYIDGVGLDEVLDNLRSQPTPAVRASTTKEGASSDPAALGDTQFLRACRVPSNAPSPAALHGVLDWQTVARIGVQVGDALQCAHQHGILHRDIKPSNLLLDTSGRVWVTDFGLASLDDEKNLTQSGEFVGTLRYMAPERFEGRADARSDVYGLGMTLYELLTLWPPFWPSPRYRLIQQVLQAEPARPRLINPSIPRDLETIVLKATAREPGARYETAAELVRDLERFLDDRPILARRASVLERGIRAARRRPAMAALALAVVFFAAFGAAGILWQWRTAVAARTELEQALGEKTRALTTARLEGEKALQAARRAQQVSEMLQGMFRGGDRVGISSFFLDLPHGSAANLTAAELLDEGVERIGELNDDLQTQAELTQTLAAIYLALGKLIQADSLLVRIERMPPDVLTAEGRLKHVKMLIGLRYFQGRYADAERLVRRQLDLDPKGEAKLFDLFLALLAMERDESDETIRAAERALRNAADSDGRRGAPEARRRALILMYLSAIRARRTEHHLALPLAVEAQSELFEVEGGKSLLALYQPAQQGLSQIVIGEAVASSAQRQAGVEKMFDGLVRARADLGASHVVLGILLFEVARLLERNATDRNDAWYEPHAERVYRMALEGLLEGCGRQPRTAMCMEHLARLLEKRGNLSAAIELLGSAYEIRKSILGVNDVETGRTAELLRRRGVHLTSDPVSK